jgi:hypothetical protein
LNLAANALIYWLGLKYSQDQKFQNKYWPYINNSLYDIR